MTTHADLIRQIQELKKIRPREDWVLLTKEQILSQYPVSEVQPRKISWKWLFQPKPAFATLISLIFLAGTFILAQNSLPGDPLYVIKKIKERSQAVFVSEEELPRYNLEIANRRLEELTEIAQTNQVKKLAPALNEFQSSVSEAAQNLAKIKEPQKAHQAGRVLVAEIQKLEENKQKVETFGIVVGDGQEIENAMCQLVEGEIEDLGTLSEKQEEFLAEAEEYLEEGKCTAAFVKILILSSYPQ